MKKITLLMVALLLSVMGANATELWTGSCTIENWSGSSITVEKSAFESAATGNIIKVTFSAYYDGTYKYTENEEEKEGTVTYWQYSLGQKDNSWKALSGFSGGDLAKGQKSASYTLTGTDVNELKTYGLSVNGRFVTVTKVELLTTESPITLFSGSTDTGDWSSNVTWSSNDDKEKLTAVQLNDYIKMTYTVTAIGAQAAIQTAWNSVAAKDDNSYAAEGDNTGKTLTLTIDDAATLEKIQQNNIQVRGKYITITAVDHIKASNRYDAVPLTIGPDGIATYGSSKNLDFSSISKVTPYYVSEVNTGTVTLTSVNVTRAWAGYIVKGTPGTYDVPVTATEPDWIDDFYYLRYSGDYNDNWVYRSAYSDYSGTDNNATKIKTYYRYIFAKKGDETPGFYKLATNYSRTKGETTVYYHDLAAHKAYLETPNDITPSTTSQARASLIFIDDETTSIKKVEKIEKVEKSDGVFYNLAGQRVAQPTKGLYIVNGKKVVIK